MGFLDDLFDDNDFVGKLGETLQDAAWFVGAPVGVAIDVAKAAIPGGDPFTTGALKAVTTGVANGTQLFFGDENDPNSDLDDRGNVVSAITKPTLDALEWVYDNAIAQPMNTGLITGQRIAADIAGVEDNADPSDIGSAWDRADETKGGAAGKGTSIGRESVFFQQGFLGAILGGESARGLLTDEGQREADEHSRMFDVNSGALDFGARVMLDPTIFLGKAAKVLRLAKTITPVKDAVDLEAKLAQQSDGLFAGFGKRHDEAVKWAMEDGRTAGELLAAFPGLREALDGEAVASVLEQTNKTMRAGGRSEEEILEQAKLITRASMGDSGALAEINDSVAFAKDALAAIQSSRDDLKTATQWAVQYGDRVTPEDIQDAAQSLNLVKDLELRGRDYFTSDSFLKLTDARLKSVTKDIAAAEREAARQQRVRNLFYEGDDVKSTFGALADRPMLASALGASTKGAEKRAARERGEMVGFDQLFQSTLWNKGVKYGAPHLYLMQRGHAAFSRQSAPPVVNVEDERAGQALDTWLKHTKLDPESRLELVSRMAAATSKVQRGQIVEEAIQKGVDSVVQSYRQSNPNFTDETEKLVRTALAKQAAKDRTRIGTQTQMFTAAKREVDTETGVAGSRGDLILDDEGAAHFYPLLETQLTSRYAMPNLKNAEHILRRHSNWLTDVAEWAKGNRAPDPGRVEQIARDVFDTTVKLRPGFEVRTANRAEAVNKFAWKSEETAKLVLEGFNHIWKAGTLATRPIAYAMRVNIDSGMRFAATMGPAAWMMHSAPRAFGFMTAGTATGAKMMYRSFQDSQAEIKLRKAIERLEDGHAGRTGEKLAEGVDAEYDAMKAELAKIQSRLNLYRTGGRKGRREAYGTFGDPGMKSIKTRAGEIEGAFATAQGKTNRWVISSETSAALLGDSSKLALKDAQLGSWTYIENTDPTHMNNWLHAVNAQLMQSEVGKQAVRLMAEYEDADKASKALSRWATGTPEGRKLMGELVWTAADKTAYTREIIGFVNHYLPSRQLRADVAKNGRVTQQELETALPNIEDRPAVHGEALAISTGRGSAIGEMINGTVQKIMRWAGDATEDQLARHPMYAAVYEQEAKRRAEFLLADPRVDKLSGSDIQRLVQEQAHKKARQAVKDYMFDVATTSDLSHFMRFTSPFIAAWEDTVRKWGRIAVENPDLAGKAYLAWNAPNDMGLVVDEDGNPVEEDGIFGYTDPKTGEKKSTYVLIPRGLTKWIPGAGDSDLKISKQSFNLVLQGGLQPGFGPLVAYPVGKIQTAAPQLNDVAKLVNPYGPPESVWDAMAPSTFKAIADATNKQSRTHEQDTRRIWAQMLAEYRLDPQKFGGQQPTIDEASKRAGALGRLKILNRVAGLPVPGFPAIFQSPYQLYIDSYRTLQERQRSEGQAVGWADEQFVKLYGDTFFPLVQSTSLNNAGLGSSAEAVQASKQYAGLISKFGVENGAAKPNLIRLIVGQEGEGDFNESAHQWQETREISPASGVMFRSYENPQEAQAAADADLGWLKYRQKMNELDARAIQDGLRTYADDEELVAERREFIESLMAEIPAWHVEWSQRDSDAFERDLQSLGEVATSGKFGPMRTDMVGVRQYLALRQALLEELGSYGVSPGTQEAQPFRQEFTDAVQDLVSSNSQFAEWSFYTFLERDPLLEPVTSLNQPIQPTDWGIS